MIVVRNVSIATPTEIRLYVYGDNVITTHILSYCIFMHIAIIDYCADSLLYVHRLKLSADANKEIL